MAETWRKLKTFYYAHRDAIWRYGSACALVAVAWLTGSPALGMLGGLPLMFGVVQTMPPNDSGAWGDTPWAEEEFRNYITEHPYLGQGPTYGQYLAKYYAMHNGSSPSQETGLEMPQMPSFSLSGGNTSINWAPITEAAKNSLQTFMEMVPNSHEFMQWYLPHIMGLMQEQPQAYPMGFDLGAGENEQRLMRMQMQRLGQIPDIASAYDQAYDNYLPVYQRRYQENTLKPAQEQLAALGLEGSSAGMDYVGKLGEEQSITEAGLWQDMQLGKANAQQQMYNLEGAQLGAAWDMSGREAQRGYDTQRMQYADWLRQTGQQAELASMLGTPTYNAMLGSMTDVFNTGQSASAGLQSSRYASAASKYGANAGLAGQVYGAQMGLYGQQLEQQFMAPYLAMANEPVQMSGGKK